MDSLDVATKANVVIGLIAVVGSILGALLGARVGASATLNATQQAIDAQQQLAREGEDRQRKAVRLLLSLEIDHNLANLKSLRDEILGAADTDASSDDDDSSHEQEKSEEDYARRLVYAAMPVWTRQAWDGMTGLLPLALSRDEIERVNQIYGQLETLSGIRLQLAEMEGEKPHQENLGPIGRATFMMQPTKFYQHAPALAVEVEKIVSDLLTGGNQIAEPQKGTTVAAPARS